jgi:hypothetical protein
MTRPNTPGPAGYLLGVGVSFLLCAPLVLLWLNAGSGPEGWLAAALYLPIALLEVSTYGLPVALAGVILVHATCFLVPWQSVHVVVAGAAGLGLAWAWTDVTDLASLGPPAHTISVLVGVSAAAGRAAVIPLVRWRSDRHLEPRGQTAR